MRRSDRLPVRCQCRLHYRPEHRQRWRCLPGGVLMAEGAVRSLSPDGRVIMITGASRGIGRAIAGRLQDDGYRLSIGVRRPADAKGFDAERVLVQPFDATKPDTTEPWLA